MQRGVLDWIPEQTKDMSGTRGGIGVRSAVELAVSCGCWCLRLNNCAVVRH